MKHIKNNENKMGLIIVLISLLFGLVFTQEATAQNIRTRLKLEYTKKPDNSKIINAKLLLRQGRRYVPQKGLTISYVVMNGEEEQLLGEGQTDAAGNAMLVISEDYILPVNLDNTVSIGAKFAGNDSCRKSSSSLEIQDMILTFGSVDNETKTVTINASVLDSVGNQIPVADEYVEIFIERLFSLLPVGDGTTDENGFASFTYEDEIPGDAEGNINLIASITGSDIYGDVEAKSRVKWGTPVDHTVDVSARALWSDQAPLWMIIACFIVLVGAWFNFGLVIYHLIKMKRAT